MNENKENLVQFFNRIADYLAEQGMAEDAERMHGRADLAAKKNSGEKKPSVTSIENAKTATAVYEGMESGRAYTATEVMKEFDLPSTSKATSILDILKKDGRVVWEKVKGKSFYTKG